MSSCEAAPVTWTCTLFAKMLSHQPVGGDESACLSLELFCFDVLRWDKGSILRFGGGYRPASLTRAGLQVGTGGPQEL